MPLSRLFALLAGIALPVVETARRWHQLGDVHIWPFWLDDFLIGGFLLYGWWRTRQDVADGRATLAAAWGFACGQCYASFFAQLATLDQPDPSGLVSSTVVAAKGIALLLAIVALILTLKWTPPRP
jgi:hypothetical protein